MRFRHALVSLGLVGALVCGWSATASVFTSDAMSSAVAARSVLQSKPLTVTDEFGARRHEYNSDDISAPSLLGLAVEIEFPRELEVPPDQHVDIPNGFS